MELTFFAYDIKYNDQDEKLKINIYGITREQKTVRIIIDDFLYPVRVQLKKKNWTRERLNELFSRIKKMRQLRQDKEGAAINFLPVRYDFQEMALLYCAPEVYGKFPIMTLFFPNCEAAKTFHHISKWIDDIEGVHEWNSSDIDPVKKLLAETDSNYCQWHKMNVLPCQEKGIVETFIGEYKTLKSIPQKETLDWLVEFKICGIDFEMKSKPKTFPRPTRPKDIVYLGSLVFKTIGKKEEMKRYGIGILDTAPLDNIEYIQVESEMDVIEKVAEVIQKENPHVITGHNINKFDFMYLNVRLQKYKNGKWPQMGMNSDVPTTIKHRPWSSSGAGELDLWLVNAEGRAITDTLIYAQRTWGNKQKKKDLNTLGMKYVGIGKTGLSPTEQFGIVKRWQDSKKEGKITDKILEENKKLIEYCVRDSEIPILMFDKLNIWLSQLVMANVGRIQSSDVLGGGEMLKLRSLSYYRCYKNNIVMNQRGKTSQGDVQGAIVQVPMVNMWSFIPTIDFASMYPFVIISRNICHTTFIKPETIIDDDKVNKIDIYDENGKYLRTHRFLKKEIRVGLLPQIVLDKIHERGVYKKIMEKYEIAPGKYKANTPTEQLELDIADMYQSKLKIISNSGYGYILAESTNDYSLVEGGESVTATGRDLITKVKKYCEEKYGYFVVYGDTDSLFVNINVTDGKKCHQIGETLTKEITEKILPKPMKIAYEKTFGKVILISKKFYIGALIDKEGNTILNSYKDMYVKGAISARSDYVRWAQEIYNKCAFMCLKDATLREILDVIKESVSSIMNNKIDPKELTMVKRVSESKDTWQKKIAQEEEANGEEISDIIELLIIKKEGAKKVGDRAILASKFDPKIHQLDAVYYIKNQLRKAMDKLLNAVFGKQLKFLADNGAGYLGKRKRNITSVATPMELLSIMLENNENLETFDKVFEIKFVQPSLPKVIM
jgi:DNA polymerase elongation subunit (family B)